MRIRPIAYFMVYSLGFILALLTVLVSEPLQDVPEVMLWFMTVAIYLVGGGVIVISARGLD